MMEIQQIQMDLMGELEELAEKRPAPEDDPP